MSSRPVVVGHRGWPSRFPDNTLAGFLAASDVADMVEADVRRSRDGKLVLSHDPVLAGRVVAETPWSVLAETDLGEGHLPALLDEVMGALTETPIQLEIENAAHESGYEPDHRLALETAERSRPGDMVTSFNPATLDVVRRVFPEVATGLAVEPVLALGEAVKQCLDAGHRALIPHQMMIDQPLEVSGELAMHPWTVNDVGRAAELVEWGVSGIITDDPGLIRKHFQGLK